MNEHTTQTSPNAARAAQSRSGRSLATRWALSHAFGLLLLIGLAAPAAAQTGVSDDRVSLPEGSGSLEGVGDDVAVNPNMGALSYDVPVLVPGGFPGLTPSVGLSYSSAGGASVVGMGWSFPESSIERLTLRGVPRYDTDDEFEVDQGEQLVFVGTTADGARRYRSRFEGGFVRYTWYGDGGGDVGDGTGGYWSAEYPDGLVGWFGATADGTPVAAARVGGAEGTFRYLLVELRDSWDHRLAYSYGTHGSTSLLERIEYVFTDGSPVYAVALAYEDRDDWLSNATGGFEEILDQRLAGISVESHGTPIRRYALSYEDYATSGGFSRLARVQMYGLGDVAYPAAFSFTYSRGLGDVCRSGDCERPFVVSMGSIEANLQSGRTQLVDLNGDALPDIVDSSHDDAPHRIFLNVLDASGGHSFVAAADSAVGSYASHDFGSPYVKVLDIDGDGFTDAVNATTGAVLVNEGGGDWDSVTSLGGDFGGLDSLSEAELREIRFLDYDNDRRIDLVRSTGSGDGNVTIVYRNTGDGFVAEDVDPIGAGFDSDTIEFNDMNGDGLLDVVQVQETSVRYRINLGYGRWSADWLTAGGDFSFTQSQTVTAELEDLNGDALSDLVLVEADTVYVWVNRNGRDFEALDPITAADVEGSLPERLGTTTVLFADMNGNGSSDVVWIQSDGSVEYLELFPVRPNLVSRIENGLGLVLDVTYGTSVEHMARDGGATAWAHRLPFPNVVVDRLDEWDALTNVHRVTDYAYHDGYYDGVEKAFRGFAAVESALAGDDSQEEGTTALTYDVGASDPYYAGRVLSVETASGGRSLRETTTEYADCEVAGVSTAEPRWPVRFVCPVATETEIREGAAASEWVRTRTESAYDGYGNVVWTAELGVVSVGGGACGACARAEGEYGAPCGNDCSGDERYTESDFVAPGDALGEWLPATRWRERSYAVPGSAVYAEATTYYDGEAFEGLPAGQATAGFVSRVEHRSNEDGDTVTVGRCRADAHGNVVEEIDALGAPDGDDHRRLYEYDADGLRQTRSDILLGDDTGSYVLRQDTMYDDLWGEPALTTAWYVVVDGTATSQAVTTNRTYDAFGRLASVVLPGGDTTGSPTTSYEYEIGAPTRIVEWTRSAVGGSPDVEHVRCLDGRGRGYQTKDRIESGRYQVSGFTIFNTQSKDREVFQPYESTSDACDTAPPSGTLSVRSDYDAMGRVLQVHTADGAGGWLTARTEYLPLEVRSYDLHDTDPTHPDYDTPLVRREDGLGRIVATGRMATAGAEPEWFKNTYDGLSRLARVTDPLGNARTQTFDIRGRVVAVQDADRGATTFTYDDLGNRLGTANATGAVTRTVDALGRPVAEWSVGDEGEIGATYTWDRAPDCPEGLCGNAAGKLVAVRFRAAGDDVIEWHGYDGRGRRVHVRRQIGAAALDLETVYDNADRITAASFPGGRELSYTLDDAGRVTAIAGYVDDVTTTERGDLAALTFGNGVVRTQEHDARRRVVAVDVRAPGGDAVLSLDYELDAENLLLSVTDHAVTGDQPSQGATFRYDAFDRLASATLDPDAADGGETIDYAYDAADDLVQRASSKGAASIVHDGERTFDAVQTHAVVAAGDTTYAYDDAGFMVERGALRLSWDAFGRLTHVHRGDELVEEHGYGAGDDRVVTHAGDSTTYFVSDGFVIEDGVASVYVSLGNQSVARHEYVDLAATVLSDVAPAAGTDDAVSPAPDGRINAADAWLAYATDQGILAWDGDVTADTAGALLTASAAQGLLGFDERITYLHRDRTDDLVAVTDAAGAVVERTTRYPFGAPRWTSTNACEESGLTDKRGDSETGLVFFGARFYDPELGRWTAPDQAFETLVPAQLAHPWEALGTYVYGWNSPANGQDEDGAVWDEQALTDYLAIIEEAAGLSSSTTDVYAQGRTALRRIGRQGGVVDAGSYSTTTASLYRFLQSHQGEIVANLGHRATTGTEAEKAQAQEGLHLLVTALDPEGMRGAMDRAGRAMGKYVSEKTSALRGLTAAWREQKEHNAALQSIGLAMQPGDENRVMDGTGKGSVSNDILIDAGIMKRGDDAAQRPGHWMSPWQKAAHKASKVFR